MGIKFNHRSETSNTFNYTFIFILFFIFTSRVQAIEFTNADLSDIVKNVGNASQTVVDWTESLNELDYSILCLGEVHDDFYRHFYGSILSQLKFENLALEATEEDYVQLKETWKTLGEVNYLSADYSPIMSFIDQKKDLKVYPVEVTKKQKVLALKEFMENQKSSLYRDGFIAANILEITSEALKTVVLYGANHCSTTNRGLGSTPFMNLLKGYLGDKKALSVTILKRGGEKTHPLVAYLEANQEFKKKIMVIKSENLPPQNHNFNWEIMTLTLNYDYIVVY